MDGDAGLPEAGDESAGSVGDSDAAGALVAHLGEVGITVHDLEVTSPSLDDVFTHLTPTGARS